MKFNVSFCIFIAGLGLANMGMSQPLQDINTYGVHSASSGVIAKQRYLNDAKRVADFILSLQDQNGAIMDTPDSDLVNEDSNMEYALMGIAAIYAHTHDKKYLISLENGISWLASRQEQRNINWAGSWYYAFTSKPPYNPIPTSPGAGVKDVRGVDTTSCLFVYLLYLHQVVTGDSHLVDAYAKQARAALNFVLSKNGGNDGFFLSSWQLQKNTWQLWTYEYSSDQADDYLGLRAGSYLYDDQKHRYGNAADFLQLHTTATFFMVNSGFFAQGRDFGDTLDPGDGFDMIFPQNYLSWVFGNDFYTRTVHKNMRKQQPGVNALKNKSGTPIFSLSVAGYALASSALGVTDDLGTSIAWLLKHGIDKDGGVFDTTEHIADEKYSNVAGFTIMALLGQQVWPK
jgi:hypothetical protein